MIVASVIPFVELSQTVRLVTLLRRQLKVEDDNDIKVSFIQIWQILRDLKIMVINLLGKLAREPDVDSAVILEDLVSQVQNQLNMAPTSFIDESKI